MKNAALNKERHFSRSIRPGKGTITLRVSLDHLQSRTHDAPAPSEMASPGFGNVYVGADEH
jgi:hypothetical protein